MINLFDRSAYLALAEIPGNQHGIKGLNKEIRIVAFYQFNYFSKKNV